MREKLPECKEVLASRVGNLELAAPPEVKIPEILNLPLCIVQGEPYQNLVREKRRLEARDQKESQIDQKYPQKPSDTIRCYREGFGTRCNTTDRVKIRCREVAGRGTPVAKSWRGVCSVPKYRTGTQPIADIFWYCDGDTQVRSVLGPTYKLNFICAPVILTGPLTVIGTEEIENEINKVLNQTAPNRKPANNKIRTTRETQQPKGMSWDSFVANSDVYISWNQEPRGVPTEYSNFGILDSFRSGGR